MNTPTDKDSSTADIHWDENNQPVSTHFEDVYFSKDNGLEETRFVFIDQNHLAERWACLAESPLFTIGETGFGTGLNFLAAWEMWRAMTPKTTNSKKRRLHFISTEKHPLQRNDLHRALQLWPELSELTKQLLDNYPPLPGNGVRRLLFDDANVVLTLYLGDAAEGFRQFAPCATSGAPILDDIGISPKTTVDAWFLDGFAPSKNPSMWRPELFEAIARLSHEQTTFSTFTAAGAVRRGLQNAGFQCQKVPGFGSKREMLRGRFSPEDRQSVTSEDLVKNGVAIEESIQPLSPENDAKKQNNAASEKSYPDYQLWHLQSARPAINTAVVIGAGLAGSQIAHALARRDIQVTVLEGENGPAMKASGNRQGAVYARLSPHPDPLSQFNLAAQIFADHFYRSTNAYHDCGDRCGILHLAINQKQQRYYQQLSQIFAADGSLCKWFDQQQCSEIAGVDVAHPGLWVQATGWISPVSLCSKLLQHPNIDVQYNTPVATLLDNESGWQALANSGELLAHADIAIIANANAALQFNQTARLPLNAIRGQTTHIAKPADKDPLPVAHKQLAPLQTVLCGDGYISPADRGIFCLGATFNLGSSDTNLTEEDQNTNINNLQNMLNSSLNAAEIPLSGRVSFRTTTPDYFPIAGPVPKSDEMQKAFAPLQHNAHANIQTPGFYHPGLYSLLGLGSRGLVYSPLAAEHLASLICQECSPLPLHLSLMLHPARFLIRDLIRNKPSTL